MDIDKIKTVLAGAALGAFALFGVGFGMSGWVLSGTAQEKLETAVISRLTPICVAQFRKDPQMDRKFAAFKKLPYEKRGAFVASQGWATMPGESKPDRMVSERCGDEISG